MKVESTNKRILYVDYIKAFLIITVVLCHINFANQSINPWVRSFNMPGFFFVSGFMLKNTNTIHELTNKIGKKFRSLMIPYYLWGFIYVALTVSNIIYILYASYNALYISNSLNPLWFLPTLFSSIVLYQILSFLLRERFSIFIKLVIMLICFVSAYFIPKIELGYPMGINVAVVALGFILTGNVVFPILKKVDTYLSAPNRIHALVLTGFIALLTGFLGYICADINSKYEKRILMADARYGNYGLFLLGAFIGIVFVCSLSLFLNSLPLKTTGRILNYIGQNTFAIYVIHKPVVVFMGSVFQRIIVPNWVALISTCTIATVVSCLGNVVLNRYAPILIGRTVKT